MRHGIFELTGTAEQQAISVVALDAIKFPFNELKPPRIPVEIGWDDLNTGKYKDDLASGKAHAITGTLDVPVDPKQAVARFHGGVDHIRNYIMGLMYPSSGRMLIDNLLVKYPKQAKATIGAEIAHNVDYFWPKFTNEVRTQIIDLIHPGEGDPHNHTWWERVSYNDEYYDLPAEIFMELFVKAYSSIVWEKTFSVNHPITGEMVQQLPFILGQQRTDTPKFYRSKTNLTIHKKEHADKVIKPANMIEAFKAGKFNLCKICKP